ncbi:MAG TPA: DUF3426 domain-containing protein [Gammaproteobacteria bacterium]|nr:DUF3426 domain-containing protein [Gammaproteobacteria bacterium]
MLTTCTECGTRFRLTAEQLRRAEGQVRCGRCGEVFDAFVHLHGDDGTPWSVAPEADDAAPIAPPEPYEPETASPPADEDTRLGDTSELPESPNVRVEPRMDDLFAALDAEHASMPDEAGAPDTEAALSDALDAAETTELPAESAGDSELPPHDHVLTQPHQGRHRTWWALGCLCLLLLLGVQVVNANRERLGRNLVIGPSLNALYTLLGHPLAAPRALDAWQLDNANVTSDPEAAGGLSITGNLANTAGFSQPWPLLRVELTDRYGDVLKRRDFAAADYLPAAQAGRLPAPGTATHFRLDVVDPGPDAVGFLIAPCFDFPNGRVCASSHTRD